MHILTKLATTAFVTAVAFLCPLYAQYDAPVADLYRQITRRGSDFVEVDKAAVFETMAARKQVTLLTRGERVHRLRQSGEWTRIRTIKGSVGFVRTEDLSDRWIFISKNQHMLYLYSGLELILKLPIDLPVYYMGDKQRRGSYRNPQDWRTPEGIFYVTWKRSTSAFYKALVLSYPGPSHASRGLRGGLISRDGFSRIVKANHMLESPPMNTILGGWIEIHGNGVNGRANWTRGCVALENDDIDLLWPHVSEATPVLIGSYSRDKSQREPYMIAHRLPAGTPLQPGASPTGNSGSHEARTGTK
ncbi:MAG: L,D-transpeptidase family protein [Rhodothermia bacterium]